MKVMGGDKPGEEILKTDCRAYKEGMTEDGLSAATVNKYIHGLDHCLTWAHGQGFIADWAEDCKEHRQITGHEDHSLHRCGANDDLH